MDIPFGGGGVYKCCLQMDTKLQCNGQLLFTSCILAHEIPSVHFGAIREIHVYTQSLDPPIPAPLPATLNT